MQFDNGSLLIVAAFIMFLFLIYVVVKVRDCSDGVIKLLSAIVVVALAVASCLIVPNEKIATGLLSMFSIVLGAILARDKVA